MSGMNFAPIYAHDSVVYPRNANGWRLTFDKTKGDNAAFFNECVAKLQCVTDTVLTDAQVASMLTQPGRWAQFATPATPANICPEGNALYFWTNSSLPDIFYVVYKRSPVFESFLSSIPSPKALVRHKFW